MLWSVWWFCLVHHRWEIDAEHLSWEEAVKMCESISLMTDCPTLAVCEDDDDLPVVP